MIEPWVNPRSEFYWFRRRVPARYRGFGMPAEVKFSLKTKDWDEALLLCNEHNLRLEREWRSTVVGRPADELTHRQIVALAGEFYSETVGTHADQPGGLLQWRQELSKVDRSKGFGGVLARSAYWSEARAFLQRKGIHLALHTAHEYAKKLGLRTPTAATLPPFLRELGLLVNVKGTERPSNAAILLFGVDPQRFFPHAIVSVTVDGKRL